MPAVWHQKPAFNRRLRQVFRRSGQYPKGWTELLREGECGAEILTGERWCPRSKPQVVVAMAVASLWYRAIRDL